MIYSNLFFLISVFFIFFYCKQFIFLINEVSSEHPVAVPS